ncbi:hypothetical protein M0811_10941 [Anaeramoeba ignava]|uniref:Rap-GAP domain-containing protein n=1 Tax=Anaeramoeba ignava TaxID=1746090 RepID=A0A9Q0R985_ANAIG|nr:hypothetical protein M0811_10941 [Anaeramoeba ignava]|eukprot:Anaeramoba_ignava/a347424_166.p1 GENE.a347424_166~~a347424_166.p1  ORF type:complete len:1147 (+),score=338.15 a347424_166:23-3463(+)
MMFLSHIATSTPIEPRNDSGVLINFPHTSSRDIEQIVVNVLLDVENARKILTSTFHIKWAMEVVGHSFSLPIEEHQIIKGAIQIYERWLMGTQVPEAFRELENFFYREIFGHMSLIFAPRRDIPQNLVEKHIEVCKSVISIYQKMVTERSELLTTETWEYLLNVLLGITDSILANEGTTTEPQLTTILTPFILRLLFDLWLRSESKNIEMWERFKKLASNWKHRKETMLQWSSTIYGLTNRVLNIIYGPSEGDQVVMIVLPPPPNTTFQPITINLDNERVIFSWMRIIHLLGNPNGCTNPQIFRQAMTGIRDCVGLFLKVGGSPERSQETKVLVDHPDGNSILKVFGEWLFEAVSTNHNGFEEGIAIAYSTLCDIFSSFQKTPFKDCYLSRFYQYVINSLDNFSNSGRSVCSIFTHTSTIFSTRLSGVYMLIPIYISVMKQILSVKTPKFQISVPLDLLRKSCITICSSLISVPNQLSNLELIHVPAKTDIIPAKDFLSLKKDLNRLIVDGFSFEEDPFNAQLLLWTMSSILYENENELQDLPSSVISSIQQFICNPSDYQCNWPIYVFVVAFDVLHSLVPLSEKIHKSSNQILPGMVFSFSKHICQLITNPTRLTQEETDTKVCGLFEVIGDFLVNSQWIYEYPSIINEIFIAIETCIQEPSIDKKKKKTMQSEVISDSAFMLFNHLLRSVGNFPLPIGPTRLSTLVDETQIIQKFNLSHDDLVQKTRYFVHDDSRIVALFECPPETEDEEPYTIIIIRDLTGRYAWKVRFRILPINFQRPNPNTIERHSWEGDPRSPSYIQAKKYSTYAKTENSIAFQTLPLDDFLASDNQVQLDLVSIIMVNQDEIEEVYISSEEEISKKLSLIRTERPSHRKNEYQFNLSRLFFSTVGFLQAEHVLSVNALESSERCWKDISNFDNMPERYQFTSGIVYLHPGQNRINDKKEIYNNTHGSQDYENFIEEIGWKINLEKHKGYKGELSKEIVKEAPYYATFQSEIVFHIATEIQDINNKMELFEKDSVVIVWCDDPRPFNPQIIRLKGNVVFFVLIPLHSSFVLVRVFNFSGRNILHGPLCDGIIVRRPILAPLVRLSALNAAKELANGKGLLINPYLKRKEKLHEIIQQFKLRQSVDNLYTSIFLPVQFKKD